MTTKEYHEKITCPIEKIRALYKETKTLAQQVIGETLFKEDLYICSVLDRSMRLTDGLILMLEAKNLTCSGALLHLQMDNCLRLFALFIANDRNEATNCIIDGGNFSKLKDKDGKPMKDGHLKEKLNKYDPIFSDIYAQDSGFIHFSEKAFYQSVYSAENNTISFQVGGEQSEKLNPVLLECAYVYIHFTELLHTLMSIIAESKTEFDANYASMPISSDLTNEE